MILHYDRTPVANISDAIDLCSKGEFNSPYRSTVPLLSLLQHGGDTLHTLLAELGMTHAEAAVHLEYRVLVRGGRGPASQTDAMFIGGGRTCAVEAKWTEPEYPTVEDWLGAEGGSENRKKVLAGWLSYLQPFARRTLSSDHVAKVTYQTVHRAASACAAGGAPALVYLSFTPSPVRGAATVADLRANLGRMAEALGQPTDFPMRAVEVDVQPTSAFEALRTLPKAEQSTGEAVKAALRGPALFHFHGPLPTPTGIPLA